MKKKICIMLLICILFSCLLTSQKSFAKYVILDKKQMNVYFDKTPPTITITNPNGDKESYDKTKDEVIKKTENITVDTDDNVKIDHNEVRYNPTEKDFEGKEPVEFENGKEFEDEGYYEITAVDTSGNKTVIVILIDRSAPEVTVKFYKKGQVSISRNYNETLTGGVALCC